VKYGEESGEREAKNADSKRWCSDTVWIIYLDYYPAIGLYMYTRRPPRCQLTGWIISGLKIGFRGKWQAFTNTAHDRQLLRSPLSLFFPPPKAPSLLAPTSENFDWTHNNWLKGEHENLRECVCDWFLLLFHFATFSFYVYVMYFLWMKVMCECACVCACERGDKAAVSTLHSPNFRWLPACCCCCCPLSQSRVSLLSTSLRIPTLPFPTHTHTLTRAPHSNEKFRCFFFGVILFMLVLTHIFFCARESLRSLTMGMGSKKG